MRNILIILIVATTFFDCFSESRQDQQVRKSVELYLEGMMYHQYSSDFPSYTKGLFHPEGNELGDKTRYISITETLADFPGINITTKGEIIQIKTSTEKVHPRQDIERGELSYFVKVSFQVVAVQKSYGLQILSDPITVIEYVILGKDHSDGSYKIVDVHPIPGAKFIDITYALEKIEVVGRMSGTSDIPSLRAKLGSIIPN